MTATKGLITVFGYGPTGEATVERLLARGQAVRVVQRKRPANLPAGVSFVNCDVLNADDVKRALAGAEQAVVTIGFEYSGKVWKVVWPKAMRNLLVAAETANVRVVHIDNMYQYGPQDEALHEDMPLTSHGVKPAVRSEITRMWKKAAREGRVRWASLCAPDFYGAGVRRSHIGDTGLAAIAKGKSAMMLMNPDQPHAFAYVPDIARATLSLLDASDDAFNQVWHVPCAPTRTARELMQIGADAVGQKLKVVTIPGPFLSVLGVVVPFMREYAEMSFTWNRPYHVDATKFSRRFWSDATPFEVGIPAAIRSFPAAETTLKSKHTSRGQTPAATTATS